MPRCPVCDYNSEGPDQSIYYTGLSLEHPPHLSYDEEGNVVCTCFSSDSELQYEEEVDIELLVEEIDR